MTPSDRVEFIGRAIWHGPLEPATVNATSPPFGGDPLNYLSLSKYLRLDAILAPYHQ